MKRLSCILLAVALLAAILPVVPVTAGGTDSQIPDTTLRYLKAKFPDGYYWNHPDSDNNPDGVSNTPCDHHDSGECSATGYKGDCGCNSFANAIQCYGFSMKLGNDCFDSNPRYWQQVYSLNGVKAGDIVRRSDREHSIFITSVSGDTITYADCNWDHQCGIRWDAKISYAELSRITSYMLISPSYFPDKTNAFVGILPKGPEITCGDTYHQYDVIPVSWWAGGNVLSFTISFYYNGALAFNVDKDGSQTSSSFRLPEPGDYTLVVRAKNGAGSMSSSRMIQILPHECPAKQYVDIPICANWAHEGIDYAVGVGLFNGTTETTFSPDTAMTRAMIATVLWRSSGSPATNSTNPYWDVVNNYWYTTPILWAYETGLMSGMGEGMFAPDAVLTREQIVTVLYRYSIYRGVNPTGTVSLNGFTDGWMVADWSKAAMQWAISANILQGAKEPNGLFLNPQNGATRAQVATILMRFLRDYIKTPN